jgi:alpha-amylase
MWAAQVTNHAGQFWNLEEIATFVPFDNASHYHSCYDYCVDVCNVDTSYFTSQANWWNCRLSGLPDLDQDHPFVAGALLEATERLVVDFGFDAVRLDAASNMPIEWCARLTERLSVPT